MRRIFRTPESRFTGLKDYPFQPHFVTIDNLQIHYIDEGPIDTNPVLLLHGVPAWSYLYRHLIKKISESGNRVIAPDLIGFGKSDKPVKTKSHCYQSHVEWMTYFIKLLNLKNITLFCHDWGSLIGLRIVAQHPDLFVGIIVSNGMLPTGEHKINTNFKLWRFISRNSPFIPVDFVIQSGTLRKLDKKEKKAYRAPFPSFKYKAAIRALPSRVPFSQNDPESVVNKTIWKLLDCWQKPFMTVFSNQDPITRGGDEYMQKKIPGAAEQDHIRLDAGHFIQEDRYRELAEIIIRFHKRSGNEP
ncbi:MAG: haloalkane dehalogenase [Bacteroidetes bacterium RBG_13_42_15]|nr:MAG: haloalkane dehalogenase [Bacteroidetes bacterium RBG_13_42_15]